MHEQYYLTCHTNEEAVTYGIAGPQVSIPDIHEDKHALEALIRLCNEQQLDSIHLPEIVENFFAVLGDPIHVSQPVSVLLS